MLSIALKTIRTHLNFISSTEKVIQLEAEKQNIIHDTIFKIYNDDIYLFYCYRWISDENLAKIIFYYFNFLKIEISNFFHILICTLWLKTLLWWYMKEKNAFYHSSTLYSLNNVQLYFSDSSPRNRKKKSSLGDLSPFRGPPLDQTRLVEFLVITLCLFSYKNY